MKLCKWILVAAAAHAMMACDSSSVAYKAKTPVIQYEDFEDAKVTQDGLNITIDKRVDILFVIDDSKSMAKYQDHLASNIGSFVDGLANKTKDIDFQIGVTVNHDQTRYLNDNSVVPRVCKKADGTEVVQWEDSGTLQYLKASDPETINQLRNGHRYVTNIPGYLDILKNTLLVGAKNFVEKTTVDPKTGIETCAEGSEQEDLFSPIIQAISPNGPVSNAGFRRPGAFLVVILVTDAKDGSGMNASQVYAKLKQMTGTTDSGQPKLRVFAVAMNQGDIMDEKRCKPDPAFGELIDAKTGKTRMNYGSKIPDHEILKLARLTSDDPDSNEQILSICSNFGPALSNFTSLIIRDVIPDVRIRVPGLSDRNADKKIAVSIGGEPLTENVDWRFNPESNFLTIYSSKVDWSQYKGQQIHVNFTPVDPLAKTTKTVE